MRQFKIMTIFGTRPEAIKMAPLIKEMEKREEIQSLVCVTAQHREMLDMVLSLFHIKPNYDLNLMKHGQSLSDIAVGVLKGMEAVLKEARPDLVLVHGDTSTTFIGALAAFYQQIKIGHVEAGLRSGNIYSPYPEEMNRRLTSGLVNYHFAPTQGNRDNLIREGISPEGIFVTGNTVIDALLAVVNDQYHFQNEALNKIDYKNQKIIVMTCHRRENWGKPMENIFHAVKRILEDNQDTALIYPVHMNPNIRRLADDILGQTDRVHLIEPLEYEDFANLLNKSYLILTDSGGIQEEAPSLGKPILVLREETERPEAVKAGTVKVVGTELEAIIKETEALLSSQVAYDRMANAVNPYGTGNSAKLIVEALLRQLKKDLN